jgi:hypothetical protein
LGREVQLKEENGGPSAAAIAALPAQLSSSVARIALCIIIITIIPVSALARARSRRTRCARLCDTLAPPAVAGYGECYYKE